MEIGFNTYSPLLKQRLKQNNITPQNNVTQNNESNNVLSASDPLVQQSVLAQNSVNVQGVSLQRAPRVQGYENNLRQKLTNNEASILAVIPRTMNAKDTDGNGLIQNGELCGNFISDVERLDEIKNMGINTLHILPIHPTGKIDAMGTAGSLYSPADFLTLDPMLKDPNDPRSVEEQCKYFIDECHKRGISVMVDMPSCASVDFSKAHPELMAKEKNGMDKTPQGWQDIRMFKYFDNEEKREINKDLVELHKKYVDKMIDLGFDGIRVDVARAKPVEFWNVLIPYSRQKDPNFGWLAETYTYEDASPQLNMPYDRPYDELKAGFDCYYGQYHIFGQWKKSSDLYDYVRENINMSNSMKSPKSLIGSFATHDDVSPMFNGGAPYVMMTTALQATLPQVNTYFVDGIQTGDYYLYPYEHADNSETQTDKTECKVHRGKMDIFNLSRKPGGNNPEIQTFIQRCHEIKYGEYKDVITKGSFIPLECNNENIIAYARHKDGKTLLVIANRDVNLRSSGKIQIPQLNKDQELTNLVPSYGDKAYVQASDNEMTVDLDPAKALIFEINTPQIEKYSKEVMQQNL